MPSGDRRSRAPGGPPSVRHAIRDAVVPEGRLRYCAILHGGAGAIVPEPAFEIYRFDTAVAGGRLVQVMPRPDFAFPLDAVLAAITPATRIVFITNPNNPTGVAVPLEAIREVFQRRAHKRAVLEAFRR